jgi:3-phenylpropionate/trans-cinnamate dioxygenase ferredoxin component
MTAHRVASTDDLEPGCLMRVEVGGTAVCLARLDDKTFRAIADECTHEQISLSDGEVDGIDVECPLHGSRFDLETGAVSGLPATLPITVYRVSVRDADVFVEL